MSGGPFRIYHETQEAGLCGVHCLNSLLQAPYYSEIDLANIARSLDQKERQLMLEAGTDSADLIKYLAEDSGNVADDGNYSLQVLSEALNVFDLKVEALGKKQPPPNAEAFICNLQEHWFTLRKIHNHWWDLNSLYKKPNWVSPLYLSVYLDTLRASNYEIFVINGKLPQLNAHASADLSLGARGRFVLMNPGGKNPDDDSELRKAITASLSTNPSSTSAINMSDDPELAAAIAASMTTAPISTTTQGNKRPASPIQVLDSEDEDLQRAIALSNMPATNVVISANPVTSTPSPSTNAVVTSVKIPVVDEPGADNRTAIQIAIRTPNGPRLQRRFLPSNTLQDLFNYLQSMGIDMNNHNLFTPHPKKQLTRDLLNHTLEQIGIGHSSLLILEIHL